MSTKGQNKRFSKEGFQPLVHSNSREMANPNDITIDIPLTKVTSNSATGARKASQASPVSPYPSDSAPETVVGDPLSEKHSHHHFHRGPGGMRKRLEAQGLGNKDKDDGSRNAVGRFYMAIYNASIITRYFIYVAPLALCIAIPIIIGATVAQNAAIGGVRIVWFFTWIEVVWCSLWVSKIVAHFLPRIFQFLVGVVSPGTRKYMLVLIKLEIPLSLVGWAVTSLATFRPLMTLNPERRGSGQTGLQNWQQIIQNILFACVFSTLVLLGEKLLIQLLSISYHRKQFDDRIKDSKRHIALVGWLFEASRQLFPMYCREFSEEDYVINDVLDLSSSERNSRSAGGHKRSGSATPMRLIQNVARVGDKVTAAFGNVAHEITGKPVFNPTAAHSIVIQALEKKHSAEALARRLWMSFVLEGRDALSREDLVDVLGPDREAEANEAFEILDVDSNGDISLDEMIMRITEFGRERRSIASGMHDVDQAINVLDNLLCTVVFVIVIFIFVAWLNSNFTTTLATAGTALLSMSFVFAATAQEVLGSCIFLFVKHPFDVGDRVDVSDTQYVVERISLLYTMFRCVKNQKRTQVPNIVLNSLWIDNVSRSKAMREQVMLYVNFDTSFEDIELLKQEMVKFVRDKENARDFQPDIDIEVTGLAEMNKMELKIEIRHKSNWANEVIRAARRSKFMCALVLALRKVPIYGPGMGAPGMGEKSNPTYSVTITDDVAKRAKADFDEGKDKKRMVPLNKTSSVEEREWEQERSRGRAGTTTGYQASEVCAVEHLTRRNPAVDPEEVLDHDKELELDRQRSNEVEQVRGMLRRESTTGRRRARNSGLGVNNSHQGSRTIPTIPDASPAEPVTAPGPARVSYFEDNNLPPAPNQQAWTTVAPLNYGQFPVSNIPPPRSELPSSPQSQSQASSTLSPGRYVPGNAFSQQAQQQVPRVPVPGMPEMKKNLQNSPPR